MRWYVIPEAILNWPAHGDVSKGMAANLAPFEDRNNNGVYEPLLGDYPIIKGDQALYFICNDKTAHLETGALEMGIEIQGMAYGFDCSESDALYNTLFIDYKIINRSQNTYNDTYIGFFMDFDIGGALDDWIASDVNRSSFYAYNGDSIDSSEGGMLGYGSSPPAQSCTFLKGPLQDADGIDNTFGIALDESINGLGYSDGIPDNERRGMDRFMVIGNGGAACCMDPMIDNDYYSYLTGHWLDGTSLTYGGFGYGGIYSSKFAYPNNSDPYHFGTWGTISDSSTISGYVTDVRGVGSTGSFTFASGEMKELTIAFVFADSDTGNQYSSVALMKQYIDDVRGMFLADTTPCNFGAFSTVPKKEQQIVEFSVFPNPTTEILHVSTSYFFANSYQIFDIYGKLVETNKLTNLVIDVSKLSAGMYFVKIGEGIQRFIKQ